MVRMMIKESWLVKSWPHLLPLIFMEQAIRMAGIGFVASYPEYRSQGRIDRIMRRILEDCYEQGIVLSYLAPFSFPFIVAMGMNTSLNVWSMTLLLMNGPIAPK